MKSLSHVRLSATPWTIAYQVPPPMGFSRQEYWSGLPFPSPGDLSNPGIESRSPTLQVDCLPAEPSGKPPSSLTRDQTYTSCIESKVLTIGPPGKSQQYLTASAITDGEGNGNPLQYSCLENPRDGRAWRAAAYGVTELDTTEAT